MSSAPLEAHLLATPKPEDLRLLMEGVGPGVEITTGEDLPVPAEFEILVAGRPGAERLDASPRLRMLVIPYAGVPEETARLLAERPRVAVHNLHHNAPATAEMAIGLLLSAAKMIVPMDAELRRNRWSGRGKENPAVLLEGETALILGFGAIGRRVARACLALGMEVVAVRRRREAVRVEAGVEVHPAAALADLLPRARALLICLPLTDRTRGLIGQRELERLPPAAVLVNVSRGPVVDPAALYEALRSGRLHSAGLDVWYRYPGREGDPNDTPPAEQPFGELDNVVLSPHRGGWLPGIEAHRMRDLAMLLRAVAEGGPVPGRVDLDAGY